MRVPPESLVLLHIVICGSFHGLIFGDMHDALDDLLHISYFGHLLEITSKNSRYDYEPELGRVIFEGYMRV